MNLALLAIAGVILVVASTVVAPRVGVAAPLLLVLFGFLASLSPWVNAVTVPPEWILQGILPPLLYSAAVSTPVMEVRRDFRLISLFSIVLVVVSAGVFGFLATLLIPGLPLGLGIALGAVISPTDPVATQIVSKAHVSQRLVTVLEGESMLNDATALVLLRTAIAAVGVSITAWQVVGQFLWAVIAAVGIGFVVGRINLWVRSKLSDPTVGVAFSLVIPFFASIPAERLGASGFIAAVIAGLVTGHGAPKWISAGDRMTERTVWRTIELLAESSVFLITGLELKRLSHDLTDGGGSLGEAFRIGAVAATVVLGIRAVFVAASLLGLDRRARRVPEIKEHLAEVQGQLDQGELPDPPRRKVRLLLTRNRIDKSAGKEAQLSRWQQAVDRRLADVDYLAGERFGWRDGIMLVWAGLRGAVTVAAVQTLPADTPNRSLVVLVATIVAVGTLLIQGLSLSWVARALGLTRSDAEGSEAQWLSLQAELSRAALKKLDDVPDAIADPVRARLRLRADVTGDDADEFGSESQRAQLASYRDVRLSLIDAEREALMDIRQAGRYSSALLDAALAQLDAEQIGIELRR